MQMESAQASKTLLQITNPALARTALAKTLGTHLTTPDPTPEEEPR